MNCSTLSAKKNLLLHKFKMTRHLKDFSEFERLAQDELRSCVGKHWYRTEGYAQKVAERMAKKHSESFEHYKCRHCAWFHVGHTQHGLTINGKAIEVKPGESITIEVGQDGQVTVNQQKLAA